jgi:cold shock CspA family protein
MLRAAEIPEIPVLLPPHLKQLTLPPDGWRQDRNGEWFVAHPYVLQLWKYYKIPPLAPSIAWMQSNQTWYFNYKYLIHHMLDEAPCAGEAYVRGSGDSVQPQVPPPDTPPNFTESELDFVEAVYAQQTGASGGGMHMGPIIDISSLQQPGASAAEPASGGMGEAAPAGTMVSGKKPRVPDVNTAKVVSARPAWGDLSEDDLRECEAEADAEVALEDFPEVDSKFEPDLTSEFGAKIFKGKCRSWRTDYGFIDAHNRSYFVHHENIRRFGFRFLHVGEEVTFRLAINRKSRRKNEIMCIQVSDPQGNELSKK